MEKRKLAIYDLDGTITKHDTLYDFIFFMIKNKKISIKKIFVPLLSHLFIKKNPDRLKNAVLSAITEKNKEKLNKLCLNFVQSLKQNNFRKELLNSIKQQKEKKYFLVLLTSSFDIYAYPFGKKFGFDKILATKVGFINGISTGKIEGNYLKGKNKVEILKEKIDFNDFDLSSSIGYGNQDDIAWLNLLKNKKIY